MKHLSLKFSNFYIVEYGIRGWDKSNGFDVCEYNISREFLIRFVTRNIGRFWETDGSGFSTFA